MKSRGGLQHLRVAHTSRVLVAVSHRDELFLHISLAAVRSFPTKARDGETPSRARGTRSIPGNSSRRQ
jgi:hypothetical protein